MNEVKPKATFLLADDHSLIRQGIVFILEDLDFECEVFHASNLSKILETVKENQIDILIMDAHFPEGNSLSIMPEIKEISPDTKILIFTGTDETTQSLKYINLGANGFLSKLSEEEELKNAILKIYHGGEYISSVTQSLLINSIRNPKIINPLLKLTEREIEIAEMYVKGHGNLEISNKLQIKQNTVSTVKKRIFEKLEIENILELVALMKDYR